MMELPIRSTILWLLAVLAALAIGLATTLNGRGSAESAPRVGSTTLELQVFSDGSWWGVDIAILVYVESDQEAAAALESAREITAARFPIAIEQPLASQQSPFSINGYSWAGNGTNWSYNATGEPSGLAGAGSAIAGGAGEWNASGATFTFTADGPTAAGTGACSSSLDGQNTAGWSTQGGSILAVACTWYAGPFAFESDIQFDPDWSWTTGTPVVYDLYSVATHEFGHTLGLGHSADSSAVMYWSYSQGNLNRTPQCDDILGAIDIYGGTPPPACAPAQTPTSTPTPTPMPTPTPTPTPTPAGTPTPTPTPTSTPTPGPSPTPTHTPEGTPTSTPAPTSTSTSTPTVTSTPTATPTVLLRWRPTQVPTPTQTPGPSPTPTPRVTSTPWPTQPPTPAPATATPTPTPTPTPAPATATPTATPTPAPAPATATPTPAPNAAASIDLKIGANLVTWPGPSVAPSHMYAGSTAILGIYYWDQASGEWLAWADGMLEATLGTLQTGEAYWFMVSPQGEIKVAVI